MRTIRGGLTTLMVGSGLEGGECPYWACAPFKAILRPLDMLEATSAIGGA
jgi:pyruvate/2-oxoglutarate dehydrogenase complex dihydrolipoamide dehydrogenase (E3) component